jgi:REP element-mobilizing transposase RayT
MPQYIRAVVPRGRFFFTVRLLERRWNLLTEHIDNLRLPGTRISQRAGMISKRDLRPKFPVGKDFQSGA